MTSSSLLLILIIVHHVFFPPETTIMAATIAVSPLKQPPDSNLPPSLLSPQPIKFHRIKPAWFYKRQWKQEGGEESAQLGGNILQAPL